ncbi:hypothetical protein AB0A63_31685 [Lentzea sp. NPDC042327]|uniref:hypothetical protein n=1 Tax=Lentzea sp. NPDC042327 TaxID=3154801 RepID=UPI0033DE1369
MTDHQAKLHRCWRTTSVQPAAPGWRLLSIFPSSPREVMPIAAWLLQEQQYYFLDENGDEVAATSPHDREAKLGPDTRVIPAVCAEGYDWEVTAIDLGGHEEIWKVLSPSCPTPTDEEWNAEIARREAKKNEASS